MKEDQFISQDSPLGYSMYFYYSICIACLIVIMSILTITPVMADDYTILSEERVALATGQLSPVYSVTLNCAGTVKLTSNNGSQYNLYAKKKSDFASCPYASSILANYDKVAYGNGGSATMVLESGVWCLMVYGYSGSGSYSFRVSSNCGQPTPTMTPTPYPTTPAGPCSVYKTNTQQGTLNQGQAAVYGYSIPSDGRSKLEWSMTSSGTCDSEDTPVIIASTGATSTKSSGCTGTPTFDLYIFKDCNPKNSRCTTSYYSNGPNSYVSVNSPASGSTYYAMVFARSGSGTFNLKMNSFKCSEGDTPIVAASTGIETQALSTSSGTSTQSTAQMPAPTAEFVLSGTG